MRLFDDKDLKTGDELELVNSDTSEVFTHARITEVIEKRLGDLEDVDFDGHEKWNSRVEMYGSLRKYYGDKIQDNTSVKVVRFKLN